MAIGVENYVNASAPSGAYPKGQITDDPDGIAGTPVDVNTYGDIHQTFMRLLLEVGVTANILPDNNTNGYQYFNALKTLMGRDAWTSGGALTTSAIGGGSITSFTTVYNKYSIVGRTIRWCIQVRNMLLSGTVSEIHIQAPPAFYTSGSVWANNGGKFIMPCDFASGGLAANHSIGVILDVDGGGGPIIRIFDPASLPNMNGTLNFDINIVAEMS